MVMEDRATPRDTFVLKRGRYDMPDTSKKLEPGVPSCLPPLPSGAPRNRLGLAQWLASPENPLTARVAVNRIWQHHFGMGLVKTAENFGVQGEPPSHPELLDWLASELVRTGWDVKALHRLIVTSATYRQASSAKPALVARDPENRLLARGPRFRLQAEVVRDNALAIAGSARRRGSAARRSSRTSRPGSGKSWPAGRARRPMSRTRGRSSIAAASMSTASGRSRIPLMATFDAPSREICQVKRPRTNTPLQALELLNDVTYVEAARQLAQLALEQGGSSPEERIALRVPPGPRAAADTARAGRSAARARALSQGFRGRHGSGRCKLIRHGESPPDPKIDPVVLAAYTATASVILNLDETITLE